MPRLGVNIDHVATLRQARGGTEPDPLAAAILVELAGADGLVVHLREDRRHIQDRDLTLLREICRTKLDLEMAAEEDMTVRTALIDTRRVLGSESLVGELSQRLAEAFGPPTVREFIAAKYAGNDRRIWTCTSPTLRRLAT